jgi:hypothetical protein
MMRTGFDGYARADAAGRGDCATAAAIASNREPMMPRRYCRKVCSSRYVKRRTETADSKELCEQRHRQQKDYRPFS